MLLLRLTCFFFIYLVSGPLLAAEPITFFKTGIGKSTEEEVVDLSNLQVVVGDRLRVRIESYDDINVTVRRAFISESDNLVLSGEVSAFQSLTLVIGTDGTVVGSISTKENSFRLYSENGTAFAEWLDPYNTLVPTGTDAYTLPAGDTGDGEFFSVEDTAPVVSPPSNLNYPVYQSSEAVIDLYMYYDKDLSNPSLVIDEQLEILNWLFENMNVDLEARVVGKKRVDVAENIGPKEVLASMRNREAPFQNIDSLRLSAGADVVHFLRGDTADGSDNCGYAQLGVFRGRGIREGFLGNSIIASGCSAVFQHEFGHNLGLKHDRTTVEEEGGSEGAYNYSYGSRVSGEYRTIMAYGAPSEYPVYGTYSWPEVTCDNSPCGTPPFRSDSADNRRSIENTKRLVSGYGGDFEYAAIQEFGGEGTCSSDDKPWEGLVMLNGSAYEIEVKYVAYLRSDGSLFYGRDFGSKELVIDAGSDQGWGYCLEADDNPIGTDIREAYFVYENPETGALIEGTHVFFDDNYSGDYAVVRSAAGVGGSVVGNPSLQAKVNAEAEITFKPNSGYKLSSVSGTCPGSLHYNVYTAEPVYGDCWAIASFEPLEGVDLVQQHFTNLLQTVMSVRGAQSSSAKADASDPAVSSNSNQALR